MPALCIQKMMDILTSQFKRMCFFVPLCCSSNFPVQLLSLTMCCSLSSHIKWQINWTLKPPLDSLERWESKRNANIKYSLCLCQEVNEEQFETSRKLWNGRVVRAECSCFSCGAFGDLWLSSTTSALICQVEFESFILFIRYTLSFLNKLWSNI